MKLIQGEVSRDLLQALLLSFDISFSSMISTDSYKGVCNKIAPDEAVSPVSVWPGIMKYINKRISRSDLISPLGQTHGQRDGASQRCV